MNNFANIIHVSLLSIMKNKRRNIFTMIGIIIGIAAVITIMSLGNGFKKTANDEFSNAGASKGAALIDFYAKDVNAPNRDPFTDADIELARQVKGVKDARIKEDDTFGLSSKARTQKKETEISIVKKKSLESPEQGDGFTEDDNTMESRVATLSKNVAGELFKGDPIGKTIYIDGMGFEVVGIANNAQIQNAVNIPSKTVEHYLPHLKPSAPQLEILFDEKQNKKKIANDVVDKLNKNGSATGFGEYQYTDLEALMKSVGQIFDSITYFVAAVAGISLFIAGIGVMNVMYISVAERTEEIAIRRAFGAKSRHIEFQFLIESVILCLIGGIIGLILGILIASLVDALTPKYITSAVSIGSILLAVGVSTFIGVVFGWIPARAASKKELIDIIK